MHTTHAVAVPWEKDNYLDLYNEINGMIGFRRVTICRFFVTPPKRRLGVHVDKDLSDKSYALNIPILVDNKNHNMKWYSYNDEVTYSHDEMYNNSVTPKFTEKLVLEETQTIIEPTFVKVGIFHEVNNFSDKPRIMLSIRFTDSFIR